MIYRGFYDLPRIFMARTAAGLFLFDCRFDPGADEYSETYKVYLMPPIEDKDLPADWDDLSAKASRLLGQIRTSEVKFDATVRRGVNLDVLSRFGF